MLSKSEKVFLLIYSVLLILELVTGSQESFTNWHYIAKPSLVIALIVFYTFKSSKIRPKLRLVTLLALVFSVSGDFLLMFVSTSPHFFTLGLVAFLIAHILYSSVFLTVRNPTIKPWLFVVLILVYGALIFYLIKDTLGPMRLAVLFYMVVILGMATTAFLRKGSVPEISYFLVLVGAILFVISDSLLAVNKFYQPFELSHISIMFTYAFAQLFLVFGLLKAS